MSLHLTLMSYLLTQEDDPLNMPQGAIVEITALNSNLSFLWTGHFSILIILKVLCIVVFLGCCHHEKKALYNIIYIQYILNSNQSLKSCPSTEIY